MPPCLCSCSVFHAPYALPSSVSCNSFVCHSYENCRVCTNDSKFGLYPSRLEMQKGRIRRDKPRPYAYRGWGCESWLGLDRVGGSVPSDGGFAEIGFVGHVAGEGSVVAEDSVFCDLLMIAHTLEKSPEVRFLSVPGFAAKSESFLHRLLAGLGIVVLVPFLEIGFAHRLRIAVSVIAGRFVFAGLREVSDGELGDFEDALGTLETVNLGSITAKIEAEINWRAAVIEECSVDIGHVATVREAQDSSQSHSLLWWGIPAEHEVHSADKMDEEIAGEAGAVFLPAAPAREVLGRTVGVPRPLGGIALPSVPIEIGEREIGWRRIFPSAGG